MTIQTKYSLGDNVFAVSETSFQRIVRCKACANTGKIQIQDESFICPKCEGKASHPVWEGRKHYIVDDGEVGKIDFAIIAGKWAASNNNYSWEEGTHADVTEIRYMLSCTGVGSGTLWDEDMLFPSREEAQAFCDAKNAKLKPDECTP